MSAPLSLVTGGSGFIGRHLVRALAQRGERVRVLDIAPARELPPGVDTRIGSVTDPAAVDAAMDGATTVYHLAGDPNLWNARKGHFDRVNHLGTRNILDAAADHRPRMIVHTSTEAILRFASAGGGRGLPRTEDMPTGYCRSKLLAEREAFAAAERGLPVVVVNPTLPVGPGDYNLTPPTRMIAHFLKGGCPAYFECDLNLIDVRDVALGHVLAAERGRPGERYVLGNETIRMSEFLAMLEQVSGVRMPRRAVPYWAALVHGAVSQALADYVTHRMPLAPLAGVRIAGGSARYDSSRAVQELGLPQNSIRHALSAAAAWLAREGYWRPAAEAEAARAPGR